MPTTRRLETPARHRFLSWRPARLDDIEALHALLLAVDESDGLEDADTPESIRRELEDTWLGDRARNSQLAVSPGGEIMALAMVFVDPEPQDQRRAYLWVEVHPDHRGHGLRADLVQWAEDRARERLLVLEVELPAVIRIGCVDKLQEQIDLYQSLGYQPTRHFYRMRRNLAQPIPERPLPEGLSLVTYTSSLNDALREAFNESFQDHWNFEPVNEHDWNVWFTEREGFRPDLTFLAMDGGQIAGFCINAVQPEVNDRLGRREGWVRDLGTRRPWRKRGVASALLVASMRAFKAEGLDYAVLGVDTQSLTGALSLYQGLGFVPIRRFISLSKEL